MPSRGTGSECGHTRATIVRRSYPPQTMHRTVNGVSWLTAMALGVCAADAPTERISACVMDGICIGHPRCSVAHCTKRLDSPRDRFCPDHASRKDVCGIDNCGRAVARGFRTCEEPSHRDVELGKRQYGQALFRLQRRLEKHKIPQSKASLWAHLPLNMDEVTDLVGRTSMEGADDDDGLDPNDVFDPLQGPQGECSRVVHLERFVAQITGPPR